MIALSVSTSARGSPLFTASPSFLSHLTRRPSSIVGESASMKILVAIGYSLLEVHDFLDRRDRLGRIGLGEPFEVLGVGHRHVRLVDAHHWRVEIVETPALDVVHHLGANTGKLPSLL